MRETRAMQGRGVCESREGPLDVIAGLYWASTTWEFLWGVGR
jgi:hypothetical protein